MTASFAGTIAFTKYNFALRGIMTRISRKEGHSTDTSRDHEHTDWTQVTRFAEQFAEAIQTSVERAGHAHGALAFSESTA
ncbi:MAG: hypothetical protein ACYCVL_16310 [Gemmatimonadaceae bacterium]